MERVIARCQWDLFLSFHSHAASVITAVVTAVNHVIPIFVLEPAALCQVTDGKSLNYCNVCLQQALPPAVRPPAAACAKAVPAQSTTTASIQTARPNDMLAWLDAKIATAKKTAAPVQAT